MAYSIVEFEDKSIRVHDLDLAVACFLLMEQEGVGRSRSIVKLFEGWVDSISFDGAGCIDLHLDEHLNDAETKQLVKDLIDATVQGLNKFSGFYPKDELSSILSKAKISLESDYRVDLIRATLTELRALVD